MCRPQKNKIKKLKKGKGKFYSQSLEVDKLWDFHSNIIIGEKCINRNRSKDVGC
jgi:hypothetical protein